MSGGFREAYHQASEVLHSIHRVIIDASTRDELEAGVCSAFADSEAYVFAWIGEHDEETDEIRPRVAAGVGGGYLDEISIAVHEPPSKHGPTATATRTGRVQVMQNIRDDPEYEPWRDHALEQGFESSAAIPITDGDIQYGVLNIYSARAEAFGEDERSLFTEVGETIGTALSGIEAQQELRSRKRKYERLTERVSDAYYAVDSQWRITYWNEQMAERGGVQGEEVRGEVLWDAFPELLGTEAETQYRAAMETQEPRSFETYIGEGFDYWVDVDVYPDEDGLSVFSREITERKERERELRETTRTLEGVINAAPDPIVMLDDELRVTMWNPGAERVFGWTESEILGERAPFVPDEKETEFQQFVEKLDSGGQNRFVDTVRQTKDGERIDVGLSSAKVETEGEFSGYIGIFKDIRKPKSYERQMEALHDATRRLVDSADKDEAVAIAVEAAEDLLDFQIPSVWYPNEANDALEVVADSDEHRRLLRESGTPSPAHPRGDWLWDVFEAGETVVYDDIDPEDLVSDVPFKSAILVPLGEHGLLACASREETGFEDRHVTLATVLGRNVTAVLDSLEGESELREQRDNLEVLDQMVRHDIRNDLQVISGYAEALQTRVDDSEREYVEQILASTESATSLTQAARDLAEVMLQTESEYEPIPLRRRLMTQLEEVRAMHSHASITVDGRLPDSTVVADEMLPSVFRNLLKNAIQHNDKEVPEVVVTASERDETVVVSIADNGPGIPDEMQGEMFAKGEKGLKSDGTGIGLYLVETLVDGYGGTVWVEDNDPEGAVFNVELPLAE
ncbi:sensor histidine kinase [Halorientalis litorea]|uniref:sensor histidine kinase n=1 Tax=Halorientalis litorea TaxID=2931977 RepID=UPI001FF626AE|nr:GAF domain-containing protein [Halorientalis litorea]